VPAEGQGDADRAGGGDVGAGAAGGAKREELPRAEPARDLDPRTLFGETAASTRFSMWTVPFLALLAVVAVMVTLSFWADVIAGAADGSPLTFSDVFDALAEEDLAQARQAVGGMGEVMAAVLGLALTVSSIIVQLAATRFTPHVTTLFFRARTNVLVNGFFVVCTVFVLWVNYVANEDFVPRFGVLISLLLMSASLLLLFPYFAYVFSFLEPDSIIGKITSDGLNASTPFKTRGRQLITLRQQRSVEAVENLANIGLNAVQQKDKNIASSAAIALCSYAIVYGDTKAGLVRAWHEIPQWNRQSPDFVSLSEHAIGDLEERGTWLEWKILRQYQMLFGEGLGTMKDLCYLIAINTRRLGVAAGRRGDLNALDLAIKFFNTYLRATINANDIRTAYNILHQYRQLGEFAVSEAALERGGDPRKAANIERRALEIARFMRYYSGIAFARGMTFITEVIAHDVGTLCDHAYRHQSGVHHELLRVFLRVDDTAEASDQEKTLRGVRRAQVKLATTYLRHADERYAHEIQRDMAEEPATRLRSIWQELLALDSREFWEVNDRGTNFDYLEPEQKAQLPRFFAAFPGLDLGADAASSGARLSP
jgi:hypothetical protein